MWSVIRPAAAAAAALRASSAARVTTSRVTSLARARAVAIPRSRLQLPIRAFATRGRPAGTKKPAAAKKAAGAKKRKAVTKKKAAKPKAAKKPRKALTPEELAKREVRVLKLTALLKEPGKLPDRSWLVYTTQQLKGANFTSESLGSAVRGVAEEYKGLSPGEKERLEATAEENKQKNKEAYRAWVESYTPQEIYDANKARNRLRTKYQATKKGPIQDSRLPKQPLSAFLLFSKSRWATHDYSGQKAADVAKLIANDWKSLSDLERQPFFDLAVAEQERYEKEVKSVFGREIQKRASP